MRTALLTDGNQRKTLAAARALGAAGWRVLVAETTACQMTRFSRYVARALVSPPPTETERYGRWLLAAARRHGADLVLPMDDGSMAAAVAVEDELGSRTLVPAYDQWRVARDKGLTLSLAQAAGVPVPPGAPAPDLPAARAIAARVGYPVVVQARFGSGGRGLAFVPAEADLTAAYAKVNQADPTPLVKRQLPPGCMWSVCVLYDRRGRLHTAFVQKQLRAFPVRGGASTVQESVSRPDLVALTERLLAPMGWRGVAEVEYLETPSGEVWLIEINPRFWGSLALAIQCGVDFPGRLAALALGDPAPSPGPYPAGRRCRWLLPGDILHYLANPDRANLDPPFWRTYDERTRDDIWLREDPLPVLGFGVAALRQCLSPSAWRMLLRW